MSSSQKLSHSAIFKRTDGAAASNSNKHRSKTVVRHDNEVYFAHGSIVRYSNLSEDSSYKIIAADSIDFEIEGITINDSGTLLAVYNSLKLVVISLPLSHFESSKTEAIKTKSFRIGRNVYHEGAKIIEVLWNGISRFDSTLIILSSEGTIRMFDLRSSANEPDSSFEISSYNKTRIGLTSNSVDNPVSMCLGSKTDLSGALTLYILNEDGDVFTVYPFMPKQIAVSRESIETLFNECLLLANSENASAKSDASQQLRFVTNLWNQLPVSHKELRGDAELCILNKENHSEYYIQGPLAIQPFPSGLYDDYGINISRMDLGSSYILLISYLKSGIIAVHPDTNLFMKWEPTFEADDYLMIDGEIEYPTLSVLELIDFGTGLPSYISPFSDQFITFVQSGNSIFKVDFSKWGLLLNKSIDNGESQLFADMLGSPLESSVEVSLKLQKNEHTEGFISVIDDKGNKELITITNERTKTDLIVPSGGLNAGESSYDNVDASIIINESLLGRPYSEISKLLKSVSNINIVCQSNRGGVISPDDFFLKELNDVSTQALKYIVGFHKVGLFLNSRLILQKKELKRQLRTTYDLGELIKKVTGFRSTNRDATSNITARQQKINERFDNLSSLLKGSVDVPLSTKEKAWFKEIRDLTLSFNRSVKQNNELKNQLSFIKSEIQTKASAQSPESYDDDQDWDQLEKVINESKTLLKSTSLALKENSKFLEQV